MADINLSKLGAQKIVLLYIYSLHFQSILLIIIVQSLIGEAIKLHFALF